METFYERHIGSPPAGILSNDREIRQAAWHAGQRLSQRGAERLRDVCAIKSGPRICWCAGGLLW